MIGNDGDYGHYDWGCAYAAANPVFLDDEIRLYYGASDGFHFKWRLGFLAMATLRPDGFAGYKASSTVEPARVTISPPLDGASSLKISADIDVGGSLTVRLLDTRMQMIDESEALTASVTDAEVQWKDAGTLNKVKAARLQFVFSGATVYSLVLT